MFKNALRLMLLLTALPVAIAAEGETPAALFERAVSLQLSEQQPAARTLYRQFLTQIPHNADAEYNLGVSHEQSAAWGPALLHLKRAYALRPAADIARHVSFVQERVASKRGATTWQDEGSALEPLRPLLSLRFSRGLLWIGAAVCAASALWVVLYRHSARRVFTAILGVGWLLAGAALTGHFLRVKLEQFDRNWAVVMAEAPLREGPDARFPTKIKLVEGEICQVLSSESAAEDWSVNCGGQRGFVSQTQLARVIDW